MTFQHDAAITQSLLAQTTFNARTWVSCLLIACVMLAIFRHFTMCHQSQDTCFLDRLDLRYTSPRYMFAMSGTLQCVANHKVQLYQLIVEHTVIRLCAQGNHHYTKHKACNNCSNDANSRLHSLKQNLKFSFTTLGLFQSKKICSLSADGPYTHCHSISHMIPSKNM